MNYFALKGSRILANTTSNKKPAKKSPSAGKKTTSAKKPAAKKTASGRKRAKQKTPLADFVQRREFKAGLIFVIGLLLLIITVFAGQDGTVWNTIHNFYFAVFGLSACYIPAAILFLGVVNVLNRSKPVYLIKVLEVFLFFIGVCGLMHINNFASVYNFGFSEGISYLYRGAMSFSLSPINTGGIIGAVFGGALYQLGKSQILANIICVLFLIAVMMLLFGVTLFKLFSNIEKPVKKAGEYTGQALENAKNDYERRKKEIAEERERRTAAGSNDATRAVNDFFIHNPEAKVLEKTGKTKSRTGGAQAAPDNSAPAEEEPESPPPSIFELVEKKYGKKNDQSAAVRTVSDAGNASASRDIFEAAAPQQSTGETPEKAPPLTAEEAAQLNSELDGAMETPVQKEYVKPPLECLKKPVVADRNYDINELKANGEKLIAALNSFNVSASISDVIPGPTVTRYELSPAPGVKISKFVGLADDLALHMAAPAGLRIEAPIPNKAAIGIEIPNRKKTTVSFREVIDTEDFANAKSKLNAALGKDISGDVIYTDIAKMPHLLVAGTTGSGKSVCMNTMIVSLLYNAGPDEVKILLIDPKQVEFGVYNGIPHLLVPVVSDPRKASGALAWAVTEMLTRYKTLNANGVRDIASYNSLCEGDEELQKMPQIVIFIDELADLMTVAPAEVEDSIQRIAQMGRAAGMHLVIATQRPSVDVITGVIKANIPSRIALTVKSQVDSRTIIDQAGAEKLMGYGDMLYYPVGIPKPIRVQGAFLTTGEIENIVGFLKANGESQYDDLVQQEIERQAAAEKKKGGAGGDSKDSAELDKNDDLLMRAIELFVNTPEKASISALQRHLGLGFAKAGRLMDTLEEKGVVGPTEGSKPRKVLITKAQWYEMNAMSSDVAPVGDPSPETDFTQSDSVL